VTPFQVYAKENAVNAETGPCPIALTDTETETHMKPVSILLILVLACMLINADHALSDSEPDAFLHEVQEQLRLRIERRFDDEGFACRGERICGIQSIPKFYETRAYLPAWIDAQGLRPAALAMARSIREAPDDGLSADDYHLAVIEQLLTEIEPVPFPPALEKAGLWADLDLVLSDGFLLLGAHLAVGRVDPETLHPDWISTPPGIDMLALLHASTGDIPVDTILDDLKPYHRGYAELRLALQQMRRAVDQGGWPRIEEGPKLEPLGRDPRVPVLRRRLQLSGELTEEIGPEADPERFSDDLVQALRRFQERHGLDPDGVMGRQTMAALNVTAEARARQVELNMERWRWLPADLGRRYIAVNTADFRLEIIENGLTVLEMSVVVGRPARRTPVFSALMTYMVLNPYWTVPPTIAGEDILPRLKAGENYLQEHGMRLFKGWDSAAVELDPQTVDWTLYSKRRFPFQLRQDPGPQNALGNFKFMFPNKFAVYLHDTPQRDLFRKVQRDFSSGCIRVEDAPALAAYLLKDNPGWSETRIRSAVRENNGERVIIIRNPIPVHLMYQTSWVSRDRRLHFRNDIYGRDKALDSALRQKTADTPPPPTPPLKMALN
jgi:L,D-transpeptidase YcbB